MKVSVVLVSYNRPTLVRQALRSVATQTSRDYELLVVDESDSFDVADALAECDFPSVTLIRQRPTDLERRSTNRLSVNVNRALEAATGDLVCYLGDDDFLLPDWIRGGIAFFRSRPAVKAGYGRLFFTRSRDMTFDRTGKTLYPGTPVKDPLFALDHNQVMHRREPSLRWPEETVSIHAPDGIFFRKLAAAAPIEPMGIDAAVKRLHGKNLLGAVPAYRAGTLGGDRE